MDKYYKKYLKYKQKYLEIKRQIGGFKYIIHNFRPKDSDYILISEAITYGTLSGQMTQHGLGTGVYGFIDKTENNKGNLSYNTPDNKTTPLTIERPLVLNDTKYEYSDYSYDESELFVSLSTALNTICYELQHKEVTEESVIGIIKKNPLLTIMESGVVSFLKLTCTVDVSIPEIVAVVQYFLMDYRRLEEHNYVYMPINYLLFLKGYNGVYNIPGDNGSQGSIKYFFDMRSIPMTHIVRSYRDKRHNLEGVLIFNLTRADFGRFDFSRTKNCLGTEIPKSYKRGPTSDDGAGAAEPEPPSKKPFTSDDGAGAAESKKPFTYTPIEFDL